jgi:hypothetical protein
MELCGVYIIIFIMENKSFIGQKINSMKILEIISNKIVKCECECGKIKECNYQDLKRNRIKGCGCKRNTPELNKLSKIRAYKLLESGVLNKGGDFHPKENREFKYLFRMIKNNSNRKESFLVIEDLKEVWHKQNGTCPYTKIKLKLPTNSNPNPDISYNMASVDRIDSSKPYTKENIQFVSRNINYAKNTMSHEETLNFIKIIIENNKNQF